MSSKLLSDLQVVANELRQDGARQSERVILQAIKELTQSDKRMRYLENENIAYIKLISEKQQCQ